MPVVSGGLFRRVGKFVYSVALLTVLMFGGYFWYWLNRRFWTALFDITPGQVGTVVIASALMVPWLDRMDHRFDRFGLKWLDWSVFSRNINFVPMDYKLFRVPFLVLLYFNLPVLAWIEEQIFRHDMIMHPTAGLWDAVWRSALFGILHVLAGAKLKTALPLTVGGLWFSWQYMYGGLEEATLAHLAMNCTGLTIMLVAWLRTGKNPFAC